jgi:DTW domain-containing protein YfiP
LKPFANEANFTPMPQKSPTTPDLYRTLCVRCLRAESVCYCADIERFRPGFETVLLQHPRERRNSIGTARLAHLCVENSRLVHGMSFDADPEVGALLDSPAHYCVVVFPGESALNIDENREELFRRVDEIPDRILAVFVIDGTWSQAKGMLRRSPRVASLPRISFTAREPSGYRVRRQPAPACLSTVEAVYRVVQALEPTPKAENLLTVFAKIVERQVEYAARPRLRELAYRISETR